VQEDVHRLAEVARDRVGIRAVDEGSAAAPAHRGDEPHLDERAERLAHGRAAHAEPAGLLLLRGQPVARAQATRGDRLHDRDAHLLDGPRDGRRAERRAGRAGAVRARHMAILLPAI